MYQALVLKLGGIYLSIRMVCAVPVSLTFHDLPSCTTVGCCMESAFDTIRSQRLPCAEGWVHRLRAMEQTAYSLHGVDRTMYGAHKSRSQIYR